MPARRAGAMITSRPVTLTIDVGGSQIKAALANGRGIPVGPRVAIDTPRRLTPATLLRVLSSLAARFPMFDCVSVGVNGLMHRGVLYALPLTNDPRFQRFAVARRLSDRLGRPVRALNDAQLNGLGVIRGTGLEVVITLGTGLGTAVFIDGELGPQLHFSAAPECNAPAGGSFGDAALREIGRRRWSERVAALITVLRRLTNFDRLYIGGGNAGKLLLHLPRDVDLFTNAMATIGGYRLWEWPVTGAASLTTPVVTARARRAASQG